MKKNKDCSGHERRPLNKKVLSVFFIMLTLVGAASLAGFFLAENTFAARKVGTLTKFDRIIYWAKGKRGTIEQNMGLPADSAPEYYQAIPQEYALGFINATKYVERALRNDSNGTATFYKSTRLGGAKSKLRFVDFFDGASYMGDLYDLRIYTWRTWGDGANLHLPSGASTVEHWHNGSGTGVASEWRFYPSGTLKVLDELYYDKNIKNEVEVSEFDNYDRRSCTTTGGVRTCTYYYDNNAARDEAGKIIYTGAFYDKDREGRETACDQDKDGYCSAREMEEHLMRQENEIKLLGVEDAGVFKGTVAFKDIDSWSAERYVPARGVESVFTTYNSIEYAKAEGRDGNANYRDLCPDFGPSNDRNICYYAWGGEHESSPSNMESWMWFNFTSTSEVPFTLIYDGGNHGSPIESSTFTVAHVIKDDLSGLPDSIIAEVQDFQYNYEKIYGKPLEEDDFFKKHPDVEPDRVLRLFRIYQYSDYDPYTMNDLLADLEGIRLKWYNCELTNSSCLIPQDPEHNLGEQTVPNGTTTIYNGYDFVSGDRIYYSSMSDIIEVDFDNTCYSDNTSVERANEVKNEE